MSKTEPFDKKTKCGICAENVVSEPRAEPVFLDCGCVFHSYCLYKNGFSRPRYSCPNDKCGINNKNAKESRTDNSKQIMKNGKIKATVADENCIKRKPSEKLASELMELISENEKLKVELAEKRGAYETVAAENKKLAFKIAKLKFKMVKKQQS